MTSRITVDLGGGAMTVLLAVPKAEGPHPAVVVSHHRDGLDEFTEQVARRLAQNGFVAAAPDFYHRRPVDEDRSLSRKRLDDGQIVDDIGATVRCLQTMTSVRSASIGIIGHCMGGRVAFLGAASSPIFRAAAMLYGGNIFVAEGDGRPAPITLAPHIRCPMIGLFGKDDRNPSPADVGRLSAELDRCGVRHAFRSYDGAGHAFQNFLRQDVYRAAAAEDAWTRLFAFLHETLSN
jgi:carboxymethylenebutenolidase